MNYPFHYAFKVKDLESTRKFYVELLACEEGRSTENSVDLNFFGHQLSAHISKDFPTLDFCGKVDGINVPIPHFGCVLDEITFKKIQQRLDNSDVEFLIKPKKRYAGKVGEQTTMFVFDFSGNPIEFKMLSDETQLFK
jgi:extradiol dioxygenase family protein